jgi:phosphoglucomutase
MLNAIADKYGAKTYDNMLIGFKYVGELIRNKESTDEIFVTGAEESYGLLKGDYARDKDGAAGALPLAEYAAELKKEGKTLYDRLLELFAEVGLFSERQDNLMYPGAQGFEQMRTIMAKLRSDPPAEIDGYKVTAISDYKILERRDLATGDTTPIDCINGDVVVLEFGDKRRRVTIRPSGTEPKLKVYTQWYEDIKEDAEQEYKDLAEKLEALGRELEGILLS